jgi:hypothetical protein
MFGMNTIAGVVYPNLISGPATSEEAAPPKKLDFSRLQVNLTIEGDVKLERSHLEEIKEICKFYDNLLLGPEAIEIKISGDPKLRASSWDKGDLVLTVRKSSIDDLKGILRHELGHVYFDHLIKNKCSAVLNFMSLYLDLLENGDFKIFHDHLYTNDKDSFGHPYDNPTELFASNCRIYGHRAKFLVNLIKFKRVERKLFRKTFQIAKMMLAPGRDKFEAETNRDVLFERIINLSPGKLNMPMHYDAILSTYVKVVGLDEFLPQAFLCLNNITDRKSRAYQNLEAFINNSLSRRMNREGYNKFQEAVKKHYPLLNENGRDNLKNMFGVYLDFLDSPCVQGASCHSSPYVSNVIFNDRNNVTYKEVSLQLLSEKGKDEEYRGFSMGGIVLFKSRSVNKKTIEKADLTLGFQPSGDYIHIRIRQEKGATIVEIGAPEGGKLVLKDKADIDRAAVNIKTALESCSLTNDQAATLKAVLHYVLMQK